MKRRNDNGNGNDVMNNDDAFDAKVSTLYRQTRSEQPPTHVDEAILALAKQQARKRPHAVSPFSARWPISASMVAVLVLAFGLVVFMRYELGPDEAIMLSQTAPMNGNSKLQRKPAPLRETERLSETEQQVQSAPHALAQKKTMENAEPEIPAPMIAKQKPARLERQATADLSLNQPAEVSALSSQAAPPELADKMPPASISISKQEATREMPPAAAQSDALAMKPSARSLAQSAQGIVGEAASLAPPVMSQSSANHCRDNTPTLTAQEYWRALLQGTASIETQNVDVACIVLEKQTAREYRRIAVSALQDRAVQQQVFLSALDEAISGLQSMPLDSPQAQAHISVLQRLTGLSLNSAAQWRDWYEKNKAVLILAPDGQHIIIIKTPNQ